jgi:hypothetical protein
LFAQVTDMLVAILNSCADDDGGSSENESEEEAVHAAEMGRGLEADSLAARKEILRNKVCFVASSGLSFMASVAFPTWLI